VTFQYPVMIAVALVAGVGLAAGYWYLHRTRAAALAAAGLTNTGPGRARWRRHVPPALFLVALAFLLLAAARPEATVNVPRVSGTVILAFDVSNSMAAKDAPPTRLAAAQTVATRFVEEQPSTVDVGIVAFGQGAQTIHEPTKDHDEAIAAIKRLRVAGGTSLGQAILASLSAIVGQPVTLPDPESGSPPPDLGYWASATIVLLSDGEDTGGPDALAAAELAANAGVRIETVGIGTVDGATIEVDGYQVATALDEQLLTEIAQTTAGRYHPAGDAAALNTIHESLDLRLTAAPELMELTGAGVGIALLLLTVGGLLMVSWYGRIL
jgi:Ca-activated chloride channel family protein